MGHKFATIAFTPSVQKEQETNGSRKSYARMETGPDSHDHLSDREAAFIAARDSFYLATLSETGWPYIQHRGGPPGFLRVLDGKTIGSADFRGNRQYISTGNLTHDTRISLILVDYPNRARLKILGRAQIIGLEQTDQLEQLQVPNYRAVVERGFLITVDAFDWNCPQHITPRFTLAEMEQQNEPLRQKLAMLEAKLNSCRCKET